MLEENAAAKNRVAEPSRELGVGSRALLQVVGNQGGLQHTGICARTEEGKGKGLEAVTGTKAGVWGSIWLGVERARSRRSRRKR